METKLKIPFEYNPAGGDKALTVYAPETKDCESANIKRGLINTLEFYDSGAKTIKKISEYSSTGKCSEWTNTESETATEVNLNRMTNLESNCTSGWAHQKVRKVNVALMGTYCDVEPRINRNIVTKVSKSKDGSDNPKILIKSTERLRLNSIFPSGLFDDVTAKTVLELKEVRDGTPEVTPSGSPSQSCTEVKLDDEAHSHDEEQGENLTKAKEGFKKLQHCLNKLDTDPHLEEQEAAAVMLGLTVELKHLNKDSIKTLYKELDNSELKDAFFQVMGLVGTEEAVDAIKEILLEEAGANNLNIHDQAASFYENIDSKSPGISSKKGRELIELLPKVSAMPASHSTDRLKHAILLKAAALHFEKCIRKGQQDKDCISNDALWTKMSATPPKDVHEKITMAKIIANLQIPNGVTWLKQILADKTNPINLRTEAAWACVRMVPRNGAALKETVTDLFFDRNEDHEVRIAAYVTLAKSATNSELQSVVQYLIDNHDNEDRQLVSYVISSSVLRKLNRPEGSKCPDYASRARLVYETVRNVANELGPRDIFDSAVYGLNSHTDKESATAYVVASKTDILPRSVFLQIRDPLQNRAYVLQIVSDGVFYGNIAKIKASHDKQGGPATSPNAAVKAALDNVFTKVKGAPTNNSFSLMVTERVDGLDISMEHFDNPQAVMQKMMSATQGSEKFIRSFKKYNTFKVKSHTESGIHVKFMTSQSAITSLEVPQFAMGHASKTTGIPISFKYSYKFASKAAYAAVAELPEAKWKYATGKIGTKAGHLPRNVTLSFIKKKVEKLTFITVKGKSDPLWGSYAEGKDIFFRSLVPFSGNMENIMEYPKLVKKDPRALDVASHGQEFFGIGCTISKSADYIRPPVWETPLTRMSFKYQEVEDNPKPFYYKIALTKAPDNEGTPTINYEVTAITGFKSGQHVQMLGVTFGHPKDAASKAIRLVLGHRVDTADPNKRAVSINYENAIKKIFIQGHTLVTMPDNNLKIPDILKGSPEWALAYPKEKITFKGKSRFDPSGRKEVNEADVDVLLDGLGDDVYAESVGELYRTDEQAALFTAGDNVVEGADVADNPYSKMIARSHAHLRCSIKAWDQILKFHGYKGTATFKKPIPEEIKHLHRRIKFLLAKRHYNYMTYDIDLKTDENTIKISSNSSVDNRRTDLIIQDRTGAAIFKGFESKIIPLLRPSSSPIKTFYHNTLNQPICSINAGEAKKEIESFDGRDIPADEMTGDCDYLLTSNCRGVKNMAVTYNKKEDTFTIFYDNKHKIVITKTGFTLDGADQGDKNGLVAAVDDIALLSYKGLLGVKLPNKVMVIRERDSSVGYIKASRLFRGRLCGLCGNMSGNPVADDVSSIADFAVSGGQCVRS